jgi:hypothetical protein
MSRIATASSLVTAVLPAPELSRDVALDRQHGRIALLAGANPRLAQGREPVVLDDGLECDHARRLEERVIAGEDLADQVDGVVNVAELQGVLRRRFARVLGTAPGSSVWAMCLSTCRFTTSDPSVNRTRSAAGMAGSRWPTVPMNWCRAEARS